MLCFCQLSARVFSVQTRWTETRRSARLETSTSQTFGKGFSSSVAWRQDWNKFINLCFNKDKNILTDNNKHLLITNTVCSSVEYSRTEQGKRRWNTRPAPSPPPPPSPSLSGMSWTEGPSCFSPLHSEVHMSLDESGGRSNTTYGRLVYNWTFMKSSCCSWVRAQGKEVFPHAALRVVLLEVFSCCSQMGPFLVPSENPNKSHN